MGFSYGTKCANNEHNYHTDFFLLDAVVSIYVSQKNDLSSFTYGMSKNENDTAEKQASVNRSMTLL